MVEPIASTLMVPVLVMVPLKTLDAIPIATAVALPPGAEAVTLIVPEFQIEPETDAPLTPIPRAKALAVPPIAVALTLKLPELTTIGFST